MKQRIIITALVTFTFTFAFGAALFSAGTAEAIECSSGGTSCNCCSRCRGEGTWFATGGWSPTYGCVPHVCLQPHCDELP